MYIPFFILIGVLIYLLIKCVWEEKKFNYLMNYKPTKNEIAMEGLRMRYEEVRTGRPLLVGNGESERFWGEERKNNPGKSDFEIIKTYNLSTKS